MRPKSPHPLSYSGAPRTLDRRSSRRTWRLAHRQIARALEIGKLRRLQTLPLRLYTLVDRPAISLQLLARKWSHFGGNPKNAMLESEQCWTGNKTRDTRRPRYIIDRSGHYHACHSDREQPAPRAPESRQSRLFCWPH